MSTGIGDIGVLKIVSEESVAAGVRRIEAVTGSGALSHYQHQARTFANLRQNSTSPKTGCQASIEKLTQTAKQLEKDLGAQKRKGALDQLDTLLPTHADGQGRESDRRGG